MLATLTVNADGDFANNIDNGDLTFREAIAVVNGAYVPTTQNGDKLQINDFGGTEPPGTNDRIIFHDDLFDADGELPITLTAAWATNATTALEIGSTVDMLEIDGGQDSNGADRYVTISAAEMDDVRVLNIDLLTQATGVTLKNLTFTGGDANAGGDENGGGVRASGNLTLENVNFADNSADGDGGELYVVYGTDNELHVNGGVYEGNHARKGGGMALGASGESSAGTADLLISGDNDVDGDDLDVIGDNLGMTNATRADGDLNGDSEVTTADLDLAFAQYGLLFDAA